MGYSTDFFGSFELNRKLDDETHTFLNKLATTRRMKRNIPSVIGIDGAVLQDFGVDGEFFVDGTGDFGQDHDATVVNYNQPPSTQPGLWCQWVPTKDGMSIEWDGGEKFKEYVEWLQYIITKILSPKGYMLNGEVEWQGEDREDVGKIVVINSQITVKTGRLVFG